jgi:2'-5' RNA ligase
MAQAHRILMLAENDVYPANVTGFEYWDGHDGSGYFVVNLSSPELTKRHKVWKAAGAVPTFSDYNPHITLAQGDQAKQYKDLIPVLVAGLVASPISLTLKGEAIDNLKDD